MRTTWSGALACPWLTEKSQSSVLEKIAAILTSSFWVIGLPEDTSESPSPSLETRLLFVSFLPFCIASSLDDTGGEDVAMTGHERRGQTR